MSTRSETFRVGSTPLRLEVRLSKADVRVLATDTEGEVSVELTGRDPERVRVELGGATLSVVEDGTRFRSAVDTATFRVPAGTSLESSLGVGDLVADVALAEVHVKTASGDVRLAEVTGWCEAKTAAGDLRIDEVDEVMISTASGDVRIGAVKGSCECTTASGDVVLGRADGDVTVRTASGDLRVARFGGRTLEANSMSGDIAVDVAPGRRVRYDFQSMTGDVRTRGGKSEPDPDATTAEIRVRSMSGDLDLGVSD